jgi:AAA+ ATPase superfamily predicted ATPase
MENPFTHSGIVTGEAFCNRRQDLKDLLYYVRNSQNVLLYSHRRTGKTSLIYELIGKLNITRPKIRSIYIDLYGSIDENDFIAAIFSGLAQIESKLEKLLKLASGLKLSGSIDAMTGQPSVSVSMGRNEGPKYLKTATQILASYAQKRKLLVVFDEFQEIDKYSDLGFEKRLRSHIQLHSNIAYIFSGSQKHILAQMFNTTDRAFYQMAISYPLKKIELDHYIKWAQSLFKNIKIELYDEIIIDIVERSAYQPMYIQQFLFELWRHVEISPEAIIQIERSILESRENEFIILWDSLTPNQRKALRLLAKTDGEAIFYAESLQRFGFNSGSILSRALSSLLKRDIITKNKSYHIQDVMLKNWVLSNLPE